LAIEARDKVVFDEWIGMVEEVRHSSVHQADGRCSRMHLWRRGRE
jgi:hypothetical protein